MAGAKPLSPTEKAVHDAKEQDAKAKEDDKGGDGDSKPQSLGIPDSAGHKGTITIDDNAPIEGLILAYKAVGKIADRIRELVVSKVGEKGAILIYNPADFVVIEAQQAFSRQTSVVRDIFEQLIKEAEDLTNADLPDTDLPSTDLSDLAGPQSAQLWPGVIVGAAGAVINSGLQLLSLFRVDHQFKNYKVDVEDQVLAVTVAGRLAPKFAVFNTSIVPIEPTDSSAIPASIKALQHLKELRLQLVGLGDELVPPTSNKVTEGGKAETSTASLLHAKIVEAIKDFDAFEASLSKPDEKTGLSRISQLVIADNLIAFLEKKAHILWLKAVAAGGGAHVKTSTWSSEMTYSGGAIASYALFNEHGRLLEADTITMYGGSVSIDQLPSAAESIFE